MENLLHIFACETADEGTGNSLAIEAGLFLGVWWSRDQSVECFKGQHGFLTYLLGIPGLLIVGLAIPLGTAVWFARNSDRLEGDHMFEAAWGFLYQAGFDLCGSLLHAAARPAALQARSTGARHLD